jgi:hypothetical protein
MNTRYGATTIFAICLSATITLSAFAQSQTTGRIAGTVKDERGAVIRSAEVTVANKATGEARTAVADEEAITSFRSFRRVFTGSALRPTASRSP